MRFKLFAVLRHACTMVGRRLKTYAFLSVTIILSFSFLLGYLLLTDSQLYNDHKLNFSRRRGDVGIIVHNGRNDAGRQRMLYANLDAIENTQYYTAYFGVFEEMAIYYDVSMYNMSPGASINLRYLGALFLPDYAWLDLEDYGAADYAGYDGGSEIVWLDSRETKDFTLEVDQVILSEKVYRLLRLEEEAEPVFPLRTTDGINTQLRVAGYIKADEPYDYDYEGWLHNTPTMILSVKFLDWLANNGVQLWGDDESLIENTIYFVYSETPERVVALAKTMGYSWVQSMYEWQDNAMEMMQSQAGNKAIIACALLVLLGINLYSSFSNAMNERKYEIGVKRAVGASAWSIVRQFLYESLLVMLANVAISIALVVNVGVLYKIFMEWQSNFLDTYVLYLTPHSMVIFGACAVTLTVVFSLIFAYKSTQVEIVQYLKAE